MERLACVDLPEFPLQLLLSSHPEWRRFPAAVVAQDKPQGEILWVSPEARAAGVLPGMRYAHGLSLATSLRAAEVSGKEVHTEVQKLTLLLRRFSPEVEISHEPGIFWMNASGLAGLFDSPALWAQKIEAELIAGEWCASIVVGFRRFAVYAIGKALKGVLVIASPGEEEALLHRVSLSVLAIDPRLRDTLAKLGIYKLGEFLRLPASTIRHRFGEEAARLHGLASGDIYDPFSPSFPAEQVACEIALETPEKDRVRLLFLIGQHLHLLLAELAERGEALRELEIRFFLERMEQRIDLIKPADLTLDEPLILDLVRLRLEGIPLPASVTEIGLTAHGSPAASEQLQLFMKAPRRDLAAADGALARIRAELGDEAVVRARLTEEHLPEAGFTWEPILNLTKARPKSGGEPALVRRLYARPLALKAHFRQEPDEWLVKDLHYGPVVRFWGPYILSGQWWRALDGHGRCPAVHRRYYFLETTRGDLLWVYYDDPQKRWFLQGQVE